MVIAKDPVNVYWNISNTKVPTAEDFLHFTAHVNTAQF